MLQFISPSFIYKILQNPRHSNRCHINVYQAFTLLLEGGVTRHPRKIFDRLRFSQILVLLCLALAQNLRACRSQFFCPNNPLRLGGSSSSAIRFSKVVIITLSLLVS